MVLLCELGYGRMRPGIYYNSVSDIMIQAHVHWVVTATGKSPWDRGHEKVMSLENECGDQRWANAGRLAVLGSNSSVCLRRHLVWAHSPPDSSSLLFPESKPGQSSYQME